MFRVVDRQTDLAGESGALRTICREGYRPSKFLRSNPGMLLYFSGLHWNVRTNGEALMVSEHAQNESEYMVCPSLVNAHSRAFESA